MGNRKYDEDLDVLVNMSKVKMTMNSHKGSIETCGTGELIDMLMKEVEELRAAVASGDVLNTIEESADVLNFLVAINHKAIEDYRTRKKEPKIYIDSVNGLAGGNYEV